MWRSIRAAGLLLAFATAGNAADIYRCGQGYQQTPCLGGQAVDAADPRSSSQHRDARAAATAERRRADGLAAERRVRETQTPAQQHPMGLGLKPAEPPASAATGKAGKQPGKKKHAKDKPAEGESPRYVAPPSTKG